MEFDKVYKIIKEDIKDLFNAVAKGDSIEYEDEDIVDLGNRFIWKDTPEFEEDFDSLNAFLHEQLSKIIPKSKYLERS